MALSLSLGLSLGSAALRVGKYVYEAETEALVERFTTPPTDERKLVIDTFWKTPGIKAVVAKLDFLRLTGADDQCSRLNWSQDAYNATLQGAPTFVADRGYTGDGTSSGLSTGFNPTTAVSPKFTQDAASYFIWSLTNVNNGGGNSNDAGSGNTRLTRAASTSGLLFGRPNSAVSVTIAAGAYPGFSGFTRQASNAWRGYAQGVDVAGGSDASAALDNAIFLECRTASVGSGLNQMAGMAFGGYLSGEEVATLHSAMLAYLQGVGAWP